MNAAKSLQKCLTGWPHEFGWRVHQCRAKPRNRSPCCCMNLYTSHHRLLGILRLKVPGKAIVVYIHRYTFEILSEVLKFASAKSQGRKPVKVH